MKKKTKIVNYVKGGVIVRSEVVADIRAVQTWKEEEFDFLKANYMDMSAREMSEKLGRSWESVRGQMKRLKLTVGEKRRKELQGSRRGIVSGRLGAVKWTPEMVDFLKANYNTMSLSEIGAKYNLEYIVVYRKLYSLGLKIDKDVSKQKIREHIDRVNARKKAYFESPEFLEKQRKKAYVKRSEMIKNRLENRELSQIKKLQKQIVADNKRIERADAFINKYAQLKQELRAEVKRKEAKIKVITDKLNNAL
jgi:hypothetical protein